MKTINGNSIRNTSFYDAITKVYDGIVMNWNFSSYCKTSCKKVVLLTLTEKHLQYYNVTLAAASNTIAWQIFKYVMTQMRNLG